MSNCHSVTQLLRALLAFTSSRMTPETRDLWNILSEWKGNMSNILTTLKNYDIFFTFLFTPPTPNPNPVNHFFVYSLKSYFPPKCWSAQWNLVLVCKLCDFLSICLYFPLSLHFIYVVAYLLMLQNISEFQMSTFSFS